MSRTQHLQIEVVPANNLTDKVRSELVNLCSRAFEEDYELYMLALKDAVHVLGRVDGKLVTHGAWITRWMQLEGNMPGKRAVERADDMLRTAYIEGVATEEAFRRRGYAAAVMRRIASEIQHFDIGGLSPFSVEYYARLGWEEWRGPLLIRQHGQLLPTILEDEQDEECLMILQLPNTAAIDLDGAISIEWREGEVW